MHQLTRALAVMLLPVPALAAPQLSAALGGDVRWFDWREHVSGSQLLDETGPLATGAVNLRVQQGPVFAGVDALWGGGIVRYNGHLQSGPAYHADADEEIIDAHWRLGLRVESTEVSIGFLQRDWNRFIQGSATVSSAQERYRWRLFTVGGEYRLPALMPWQPALAVEMGTPLQSHQKVYSQALGDFELEPGHGVYWRVALPLYGNGVYRAWRIEPYYQQQTMGASGSVSRFDSVDMQNLIVFQPASVRRELGVGVRWQVGVR